MNTLQRRIAFVVTGIAFVLSALPASTSQAKPACIPDLTYVEERTDNGMVRTYKMAVTPAAAPIPALKHRFTILPHETLPGNFVTHYLRSFGEGGFTRKWQHENKKFGYATIAKWLSLETPASDAPLEDWRQLVDESYIANHLERAAYCRDVDWGLAEEDLRGAETFAFLLPSVQQSRSVSRMLMIRVRLAIAEGRFDDAIETLKINLKLAQSVGEMKFLVSGLVGIAEVGMGLHAMPELIAAPDSPNLYWALAEIDTPIIDLRDTFRLEFSSGLRLFPAFQTAETATHSDEEWAAIYRGMWETFRETSNYTSSFHGSQNSLNLESISGLIGVATYRLAKQRLIKSGIDSEKVNQMSAAQCLIIDAAREFQTVANEYEKALYVPASEFKRFAKSVEDRFRFGSRSGIGTIIADLLLMPATQQVVLAEKRVQWQRCGLQVVEAIRMHLAETGELPKTLADISIVPLPENPATGKSFVYWLDGGKAVVDMPFSDGFPGFSQRFEITIAK